jgi:hypothetical protein
MITGILIVRTNVGNNYYYVPSSSGYDEYEIWEELSNSFVGKDLVTEAVTSLTKRGCKIVDVEDVSYDVRQRAAKNLFLEAAVIEVGYDSAAQYLYVDEVVEANEPGMLYGTGTTGKVGWVPPPGVIDNEATRFFAGTSSVSITNPVVETSRPSWVTSNNNNDNNQTNNKKTNSMTNLFKGINLEFGKYNNPNVALSFAGIAVRRKDGQWVTFDRTTQTLTEVGDLKFDMDFYKVPVQTLAAGDITEIDGQIYIVEEIKENGNISCVNPGTGSKSTKIKRNNLFNMYFYTKIVSMMDMFGGGAFGAAPAAGQAASPFGNINPMMLMAMSGDKGGDDISSVRWCTRWR